MSSSQTVTVTHSNGVNDPPANDQQAKISELRGQVDGVRNVMSDNMIRIMERGERLDTLDSRTQALQESSMTFGTTSRQVSRAMWWKDMKWRIILILVIVVGLIIALLATLYSLGVFSGKK